MGPERVLVLFVFYSPGGRFCGLEPKQYQYLITCIEMCLKGHFTGKNILGVVVTLFLPQT